ncbi:LacI family DNA-binding transcriptional regulator [Streptomyces griseiscabiei]|uniref:LacI family DNA-binding transcriptional regulator n=1 Tax=Streptomyces griseiscabiei TaxID=2993540 RepID=A0ABU4L4V9_9ACTN|nr:LacI family DNA-binding transcriptional regulator [Streptomyces griseiscabiei]MDX2910792.1 LacI family DNA-binding transcriptional regulator [Streptomyces griseiscabiei]
MTRHRHPYTIREIARQSGLSTATVDRVLNHRGNVRESTVREVRQAVEDLDRQRGQVRIGGRTFMIDIVMQAPERFTTAVRAALEAELPSLHPAVVRSRFHFRETGPAAELVAGLDRIARRGSQGVLLKAPDLPEISAAVGRLAAAGIPVVTLVTDLPGSARVAYVGIDNRAAGCTAAYLVGQWLGDRPGHVLTTISRASFRGEEEREMGFRSAMRLAHPARSLVEVTDSDGLDATQRDLVLAALRRDEDIVAVYSMGGGNLATLDAFDELGRNCAVFVAHDLDHDNTGLLRERRLSAVLHHDLRQDVRRACQTVMRAHGALPDDGPPPPSTIQVVTPCNMPPDAPGPAPKA